MKKTIWLLAILSCALLVATTACGDDNDNGNDSNNQEPEPDAEPDAEPDGEPDAEPEGDAPDCSNFNACGGDHVGTFSFSDACVDNFLDDPFEGQCPDAEIDFEFDVDGTVEIKDDNTYTLDISTTTTLIFNIPASCLGGACTPLEEEFDCELNNDVCNCTQLNEDGDNEEGTYTADGNTLTFTNNEDGSQDTLEFCVSGGGVLIKPINDDPDDPEIVFSLKRE